MKTKYKSMSNDIRRVQIAEKLKSDQLNKLLNNVGQDIQESIDDPYGYLLRRNYSKETVKLRPKISPQRHKRGTMTIEEIWTKKMQKQCDSILQEMRKKNKQQILSLTKLQSISTRFKDDSCEQKTGNPILYLDMNATKMIQQYGFRTLMPKKKKSKNIQKLQSIICGNNKDQEEQSNKTSSNNNTINNIQQNNNNNINRPRVSSNVLSEPQVKTPLKKYYNNSETTSSSTKQYYLSNFRKYSVQNQISQGIQSCMSDCDGVLRSYKSLHRVINKPQHNKKQIYLDKQRHEQLREILKIERNKKLLLEQRQQQEKIE